MSKQSRKVGKVLRQLKKAKTPADTMAILAKLRQTDPATYQAIQNLKGN